MYLILFNVIRHSGEDGDSRITTSMRGFDDFIKECYDEILCSLLCNLLDLGLRVVLWLLE